MNKKAILIGGALVLAYFAMQPKKENGTANGNACAGGYFLVDGTAICAEILPDLGYTYWKGGTAGDGWYYWEMFNNAYNVPVNAFKNAIIEMGTHTVDPTNQRHTSSNQFLNNAVKANAAILPAA